MKNEFGEGCYVEVRISLSLFSALFLQDAQLERDDFLTVREGLPLDVEMIAARVSTAYDHNGDTLCLVYEHPSFALVLEGAEIPQKHIIYDQTLRP